MTRKLTPEERDREAIRAFRGKGYGIGGKPDCYYDPSNASLLFRQPKNTGKAFAVRRWLRKRIRALYVADVLRAGGKKAASIRFQLALDREHNACKPLFREGAEIK